MTLRTRPLIPMLVTLALSTACGSPVDEPDVSTTENDLSLKKVAQLIKKIHGKHKHGDKDEVSEPLTFTPATAAAKAGRLAGTAVAYDPLVDSEVYRETLAAEFNYITPENAMKWGELQSTANPNVWDFQRADAILEFAEQNSMKVKGHALIWHSQAPQFIDDNLKRAKLNKYMTRHIHKTTKHYRHQLHAWDVVNEAVADDGSGLRDSVFSRLTGDRFIKNSFRLTHAFDHKAKMIYNDYGTESLNAKSDAVFELMQRMVAKRVPIDEVGFQAHFDARFVPSKAELVANFERFGDLGLTVNVSELDVRIARVAGTMAHKLGLQKQIFQRVAAACVEAANCTAVTTWGFTDAHSWIDAQFGADDALLFDENYQRKPAYYGFVDGFLGVTLDESGDAPNIVGNSSFETGLDQWSMMGDGALQVAKDVAHSGYRSAKAVGRTANWQGPRYDVQGLVEAGRDYDVSVFTRLGNTNTGANVNLTAQVTCAGEAAQFVWLGQAAATATGWASIAGTLQVPNCDVQDIAVYAEGPDAGVDIYVDDFTVRERPLANLLPNPDFESGTSNWFGWGSSTIGTSNDARSGDSAAVASGRTANWNGIATNILPLVEAEGVYSAGAYVKLSGASSATVTMTAKVRCDGGADQYINLGSVTATDSSWGAISGSLELPNCSLAEAVMYAEGPAAGVDIYLDDASLYRQPDGLGSNVVSNGGFESGTSGWFGFGSVTVSAASNQANSGSYSGLVSGRTGSWNGLATNLTASVTQGSEYRVRGYARLGGAASSSVNLSVKTNCDGTDSFATAASATATDSGWVLLDGSFMVPVCGLNELTVYIEGAPAGVDIYLDDVSVREIQD